MTNLQKRPLIFLLGLAILGLIFLAMVLPELKFKPGEPFPFAALFLGNIGPRNVVAPTGGNGDYLKWIARAIIWVGLPFSIIYLIVSPEARQRLRRMLPAIITILFLAYMLNYLPKNEQRRVEEENAALGLADLPTASMPPTPAFIADPPQWLLVTVNLLLGLLIIGIIWFLWRLFHRKPEEEAQALIIQKVEAALSDLEAGKDLKNTIIRCYAEMSHVLNEEKHVKRRRGMTAREFETQLAMMGLDDLHIQQLTRLFERARYSTTMPGGREEREAVDCLNAIVRAYGKAT